jgi:hypothetical protein
MANRDIVTLFLSGNSFSPLSYSLFAFRIEREGRWQLRYEVKKSLNGSSQTIEDHSVFLPLEWEPNAKEAMELIKLAQTIIQGGK